MYVILACKYHAFFYNKSVLLLPDYCMAPGYYKHKNSTYTAGRKRCQWRHKDLISKVEWATIGEQFALLLMGDRRWCWYLLQIVVEATAEPFLCPVSHLVCNSPFERFPVWKIPHFKDSPFPVLKIASTKHKKLPQNVVTPAERDTVLVVYFLTVADVSMALQTPWKCLASKCDFVL